ncbi:MAG TPA: hypothetical protein P5533_05515 [Candidatus Cloacimonadota bacterium]|nr:hypothetical protein [Candidatus Cloacimonadota bacterium]
MQKLLIIVALVAFALIISSCTTRGEIRVRNYSTTDIIVDIDYTGGMIVGPNRQYSEYFGDSRSVHVSYSGIYLFDGYTDIYIEPGDLEILTLNSDGGAVQLVNNSPFTIDHLYLATSSASQWGPDDLTGQLAPGGSILWTASPGNWDLKIVNNQDDEFFVYGIHVDMDETDTVLFDGDKSRSNRKGNGLQEDNSGRTVQR